MNIVRNASIAVAIISALASGYGAYISNSAKEKVAKEYTSNELKIEQIKSNESKFQEKEVTKYKSLKIDFLKHEEELNRNRIFCNQMFKLYKIISIGQQTVLGSVGTSLDETSLDENISALEKLRGQCGSATAFLGKKEIGYIHNYDRNNKPTVDNYCVPYIAALSMELREKCQP